MGIDVTMLARLANGSAALADLERTIAYGSSLLSARLHHEIKLKIAEPWLVSGSIPHYEDQGGLWIAVDSGLRFYGPGYERGDPLRIFALAWWLERSLGGEVWYGGNEGGGCRRFDDREREAMLTHFFSERGTDYWDRGGPGMTPLKPPFAGLPSADDDA